MDYVAAGGSVLGAILLVAIAVPVAGAGFYLRAKSKDEFLREFGAACAFLLAGLLCWVAGAISGSPEAMYLLAAAGTIVAVVGVTAFIWFLRRQQ